MSRRPAGSKRPKDPNAPKAALSSYFIFSNERRSILMAEHKDMKITEISKLISAEWKLISDSDKASYQQRAIDLKTEYKLKFAEYQKTDAYKAHQIKIDQWKEKQKNLRNGGTVDDVSTAKISLPRKPKDKQAPKKPPSSYFLFADTVRAQIKSENPSMRVTEIAKIIGQKWKELSDDEKAPFGKEAARLKEEHKPKIEAYAQSEEAKAFATKLAEWKEECDRRKRVYAAKQAKALAKQAAVASRNAKGGKKGKKGKNKKMRQKKFEESSESDDSDSDSSGSSSGSEDSSSSGSGSSSGSYSSSSDSD